MLIHWIIFCTEIIQMTYSIHQHWDPLQVCAVGRSYPPEFYSYIDNVKVRTQFEQIAEETEQDYQSLIKLLQSFDVKVVRTEIDDDYSRYFCNGKYSNPVTMTPRDWCMVLGNKFYTPTGIWGENTWRDIKGVDWPDQYPGWDNIEPWIKKELIEVHQCSQKQMDACQHGHTEILELVKSQGNEIIHTDGDINSAMITRIGRDLYHGTKEGQHSYQELLTQSNKMFPEYRNHVVDSQGHSDGSFCPVKPGLIVSLFDIQQYDKTFPDWEVIYLPNQSWSKVMPFLQHKDKVAGKWWVPGAELNDDFTEYVESWMSHWVGYVEESVFDVNMLVIDEQNVICNNENDTVFRAFEQHGITPHVCNFRHRYFWDGGIHCVTQDLHRLGKQKDYFPERG